MRAHIRVQNKILFKPNIFNNPALNNWYIEGLHPRSKLLGPLDDQSTYKVNLNHINVKFESSDYYSIVSVRIPKFMNADIIM
jgi:hypothetical protein